MTHVAADVSQGGDILLLWSKDHVRSSRYTGSWSAAASWGKSVASITGLAVNWHADFRSA